MEENRNLGTCIWPGSGAKTGGLVQFYQGGNKQNELSSKAQIELSFNTLRNFLLAMTGHE